VALVGAVSNWIRFKDRGLVITDQFADDLPYVDPRPQAILAPAGVEEEPQPALDGVHLAAYRLVPDGRQHVVNETVKIDSRLGTFEGRAVGPALWLLVPTGKSLTQKPVDVDTETQSVPHYACYDLKPNLPTNALASLTFTDQFRIGRTHRMRLRSALLCNPAEKNSEPIRNPNAPHLVCFNVVGGAERENPVEITLRNQFGDHRAVIELSDKLCVAASKKHIQEEMHPDLTIEPVLPSPPTQSMQGFPGFEHCLRPPQGGASRRIVLRVRNIGSDPAGPSTLSVSFANQNGPVTMPVGPLAQGAAQTMELPIPNGCHTGSGASTCRFEMVADSAGVLVETDETNNASSSFCIQPTG
jgi:hypothetical protein